jgi:hypothetical protein
MATLKISDRDEVLRRVLAETFTPRFGDIQKQMQAALRASLAAEHPQFVKLAKDPESRKYLATTNVRNFYFIDGEESHIAASPCYGKWVDMPAGGYRYLDRDSYSSITDGDTAVPCSMSEFKITDRKMVKVYKSVWADYVAARDKLRALLNSYTMREKFAGDFPEFAKYLPPVPTKARLPAVIVKDVRAELSKLGIPQK